MSDASQQRRARAKLKELIERASSAAEANLHRGIKPYPSGFAVRANGSKFAFEPQNIEGNDAVVALIRTLFLQHNVVCYVLTLGAVLKESNTYYFPQKTSPGRWWLVTEKSLRSQLPIWGLSKSSRVILQRDDLSGLLPRQAAAMQ